MESNSEPEAFPFDLSGLEFTEESTSQAPVEMPNVQVRFDLDEDEWMFGDVDVVHALLQTERTKI